DKGINVLIPNEEDIESINNTIFKELCLGEVNDGSRETFKIIIDKLKQEGAEGIILGCTEIGLLIHPTDVFIPVFDTTLIHAKSAVKLALDDNA
ncbi:MAG: aspartate/glutamate racemase family protein, partial [Longicatena sp.]